MGLVIIILNSLTIAVLLGTLYGQPHEHVLYGALVGRPKLTNDFDYQDDRNDWIGNEVGTGYNAPLTSALIQAYDNFGGDPLTDKELDALVEIDIAGI